MERNEEQFKNPMEMISDEIFKKMTQCFSTSYQYKIRDKLETYTIDGKRYYRFKNFVETVNLIVPSLTIAYWGPSGAGKTTIINLSLDPRSQILNEQSIAIDKGTSSIIKMTNALSKKEFQSLYPHININIETDLRILKRIEVNCNWIFNIINNRIKEIKSDYLNEINSELDKEQIKIIKLNSDAINSILKISKVKEKIIEVIIKNLNLKKQEILDAICDQKMIDSENKIECDFIRKSIHIILNINNKLKNKFGFNIGYNIKQSETDNYQIVDKIVSKEILSKLNNALSKMLNESKLDVEKIHTDEFKEEIKKMFFECQDNSFKEVKNFIGKYIKIYTRYIKKIADKEGVLKLLKLDSTELNRVISLIEYDGLQSEYVEQFGIQKITSIDSKGSNDRKTLKISNTGLVDAADIHVLVLTKEDKINDVEEVFTDTDIKNSKIGFIIVNKDLTKDTPGQIKEDINNTTKSIIDEYKRTCISKGLIKSNAKDLINDLMFTTLYFNPPWAIMPRLEKYKLEENDSDIKFAIENLSRLFTEIKYRKLFNIKILLETFEKRTVNNVIEKLGEEEIKKLNRDIFNLMHGISTTRLDKDINQYPRSSEYVKKNIKKLVTEDNSWSKSYIYHYSSLLGFTILKNICNILYERLINENFENNNRHELMSNLIFFDELSKYLAHKNKVNSYTWWSGSIKVQRLSIDSFSVVLNLLKEFINENAYNSRQNLEEYTMKLLENNYDCIMETFIWMYIREDFFRFKEEIKESQEKKILKSTHKCEEKISFEEKN